MNTLCLTIDFINELCHADGKIAGAAARVAEGDIIANANRVLAWARAQGLPVAHVKVGFDPHYRLCPAQSPIFSGARQYGALQLGTWGTEFCEDLDARDDEPVIVKHRISAFYGTDLRPLISALDVGALILMGVSSEQAIELTAREAHDRDLAVTVVSDACTTASPEQHAASMNVLRRVANVVTVADLIG